MKNNEDKNLELLMQKLMNSVPVENPSDGFTENVLKAIHAGETSNAFVYKPLITKGWWIFISCVFAALVVYFIFNPGTANSGFKFIPGFFNSIESIVPLQDIPSNMASVLLVAILMICVQIFLLKYYFDKRLEHGK